MGLLKAMVYAAMAAVLACGWAFFWMQSSAAPLGDVDAARSALNALRAIDARWNDQLVSARASGGRFEPARHGRTYADLEVRALRVQYPGIGLALAGVKHAFEDKAAELGSVARGEARFDQAWLAPAAPRLDAMSRALDRAFDDALIWTELYRVWLLYYSLFLVTVFAYAMWRIREARGAS